MNFPVRVKALTELFTDEVSDGKLTVRKGDSYLFKIDRS